MDYERQRMKTSKRLYQNSRIRVFGFGWWFYILLAAVLLVVLTILCSSMDRASRKLVIFILSLSEYIILRIYKYSLKNIRENYNFYNELPCYLCNQSTILCMIGALTESDFVMSYCVTAGFLGALLAVLMPDQYNQNQLFFSRQAFGFYGYHSLLMVTCLSFYTLKIYEPVPSHALGVMAMIFLLACIAHLINYVLRKSGLHPQANYVYTYFPENIVFQKCYDLFPVKVLYMIPIMLGFGAVSYVMLVVMKLFG